MKTNERKTDSRLEKVSLKNYSEVLPGHRLSTPERMFNLEKDNSDSTLS